MSDARLQSYINGFKAGKTFCAISLKEDKRVNLIVERLAEAEQKLVSQFSKLGSDDETLEISFGEARALRSFIDLIESR